MQATCALSATSSARQSVTVMPLRLEVVHDELGHRAHIRHDQGHAAGADRPQCVHESTDARGHLWSEAAAGELLDDGGLGQLVLADLVRVALGHEGDQAGVEDRVYPGVADLVDAALALGVHRPQLLGPDGVHPHTCGVEGEARAGVSLQQRRHLRLDVDVRAGHYQPDTVVRSAGSVREAEAGDRVVHRRPDL